MGGGGLYGTAGDYIKFHPDDLNKGRGKPAISSPTPKPSRMMGPKHIGELTCRKLTSAVAFATNDVDLLPGMTRNGASAS